MKPGALLTAAAASAGLAAASPVGHHKREVGGILMCTGQNATGDCHYDVYQMETCYNLTSTFYENTNTFAPDGEAFYCYPYPGHCNSICTSPTGCTFGAIDFAYPHKYDLSAIEWDNLIGHFECHKNQTTPARDGCK